VGKTNPSIRSTDVNENAPKSALAATLQAISEYAKWASEEFDPAAHGVLFNFSTRNVWKLGSDQNLWRQPESQAFSFDLHKVLRETNSLLWCAAVSAVESDPLFKPWLGCLVGTELGSQQFLATEFVERCVMSLMSPTGELTWDSERVSKTFSETAIYFSQDTTDATILIALPGLNLTNMGDHFDVGGIFKLGIFSEAQFEICAYYGIVAPESYSPSMIKSKFGRGIQLKVKLRNIRKTIGQPYAAQFLGDRAKRKFGELTSWAVDELVEDLLFVLRLATKEKIFCPGAALVHNSWSGSYGYVFKRPISRFVPCEYSVTENLGADVTKLWEWLTKVSTARTLPRICARRFNAAVERNFVEDAIVDATISAEALFLQDMSGDKSGLGYRLQLRAAKLLEKHGHDSKEVFEIFKVAYNLRSTIVHGGAAKETLSFLGTKITLGDFLDKLLNAMRDALRIAAEQFNENPDFALAKYWDELILGK
jgi:Apea-like HEPN